MNPIDLHMHSSYSNDGEYAPDTLISLCRKAGVKTLALADHNTAEGVEEALGAGQKTGVEVIPTIELDCTHQGVNLHLLGYFIDYKNPAYAKIQHDILLQEQKNVKERLRLVHALGIAFDDALVWRHARNGVFACEKIAQAALSCDAALVNPLLAPYLAGGARSESPYVNFYWDLCAQGKPAYVHTTYIDLKSAAALIKATGGVAILAHPGNNLRDHPELLDEIIDQGVQGVEAYSTYHTPQQAALYRDYAEQRGLAVTCGSDFHGRAKPNLRPGDCDCSNRQEAYLAALKALRRK